MSFLAWKVLHILSAIVLFGVGLGSVFYKIMADRSGNVAAIAVTSRNVVLADWWFTTPTVIFQFLSGLMLASKLHLPLDASWLTVTYALYGLTGFCWLPVVGLQIALQNLAREALTQGEPLPERYWFYTRIWMGLGIPAFTSMIVIVTIMVFHDSLWS
jgi:uncharacterized membrane protein